MCHCGARVAHEEYLQRVREARSSYLQRFAELFPEVADSCTRREKQLNYEQKQLGRVEMLQAVLPNVPIDRVLAEYASALDAVDPQSAVSGTRSRSGQAKIERSRRALLDAGFELALVGQKPTLPEILARAGVSRSTFYRHFSSWEELLVVAIESQLMYWGI